MIAGTTRDDHDIDTSDVDHDDDFLDYLDTLQPGVDVDVHELRWRYDERRRDVSDLYRNRTWDVMVSEHHLHREHRRAETYKVILIIAVVLIGGWLIGRYDSGGSDAASCVGYDCVVPDPNDQWDFPPLSRP